MKQLDSFAREAIRAAITKLFSNTYYDIGLEGDIARVGDFQINPTVYAQLRLFHCVD